MVLVAQCHFPRALQISPGPKMALLILLPSLTGAFSFTGSLSVLLRGGRASLPRELSSTSSPLAQKVAHAHLEFSINLYRAMVRTSRHDANLAVSPAFVTAFLMPLIFTDRTASGPHPGCYSETVQQIINALRMTGLTRQELTVAYNATLAALSEEHHKSSMKAFQVLFLNPETSSAVRHVTGSDHLAVQFGHLNDSTRSLKEIDRLIHREIGSDLQKIIQRFPRINLEGFLVSATSFRSDWQHPFDPTQTFEKGFFYYTSRERREIPLMNQRLRLPLGYLLDLQTRIVEIPLAKGKLSFFIILPDNPDGGLALLEKNFTMKNLQRLLSTLKDEIVNLRLPRFEVDAGGSLLSALKELGLKELFVESRKGENRRGSCPAMSLNDIIHRTTMKVLERNTGDHPGDASPPILSVGSFQEKFFEVDHPFIFFVWDYMSSILLYLGRIAKPHPLIK